MSSRKNELSPEQRKQLREEHMQDVRFYEKGACVIITKYNFTLNDKNRLLTMTPIERSDKEEIKAECLSERDAQERARIEQRIKEQDERRCAEAASGKPKKKPRPPHVVFYDPSSQSQGREISLIKR